MDHMDVRATAQSHAPEAVRHDSFSTGVLHHIAGRVTRATSHVSLHCVCRGLSLSLCVCVCQVCASARVSRLSRLPFP